jgi:AcrR family transcriptional regulator
MVGGEERRERRKAVKRREIKLAAVHLVLSDGLDALTVESISDAADISPRTFHNYFSTKEEALLMVEPSWSTEELLDLLEGRPADESPIRSFRFMAKEIAESYVIDREEIKLWNELWQKHPELLSKLEVGAEEQIFLALILAVSKRMGVDPSADIYPGLLVTTAFSAIQFVVRYSWLTDNPVDDLIDRAFDQLESGF